MPIQTLVDCVTLRFVPAVMTFAALTLLGWIGLGPSPVPGLALVNAVAMSIIACPCAMGLATPTSTMVDTGRVAEHGILFRKGEALQSLEDARVFTFDKTGTLTAGKSALTDLVRAEGFTREVPATAAATEAKSTHPIRGARNLGFSVEQIGECLALWQDKGPGPGLRRREAAGSGPSGQTAREDRGVAGLGPHA